MAEEHLHQLHVVFDQFREYNLKLKPSKCSLFKEEINYLVHWVSKEGVQPSDLNLKVIMDCAPPQTYTEVHAFLGLLDHYWQFIKGFVHITQLLNEHLTGERASRKSEWVLLSEDTLKAVDTLKQACMRAPSVCWLYKGISTRDWCIKGGTGGTTVPKAGRWVIPLCHLWYQSSCSSWEKLPFHQAQVSSAKVGSHGTFQRVLTISTLPSEDQQ